MRYTKNLIVIMLGFLAITASAQQPTANPTHPNATFTVNGATVPLGTNDFNVFGQSTIQLEIATAVSGSQPVILASGILMPTAIPTPWGGTIDLIGVQVLADGYSFSTGTFLDYMAFTPFGISFGVPNYITNSGTVLGSLQAIVIDPTNTPIPLRNSVAVRLTTGYKETVYTMGDDDFVQHTISTVLPIRFYDTNYTHFHIGSNGFVTFGFGTDNYNSYVSDFFGGLGGSTNPAVAVAFADLNRDGQTSGATYAVIEEPSRIVVEFRNQRHYLANDPAGTFSCEFLLNGWSDVRLNVGGFIPGTSPLDDVIIGLSDGTGAVGVNTNLSDATGHGIANAIGVYQTPFGVGPDSICEYFTTGMQPAFATALFFDMGLGRFAILP